MLKNQRKDTYQLCVQSLLLPPSFRFPPLREGNRARVEIHPRFARGTVRGLGFTPASRGEPCEGWGSPPLREGNREGRAYSVPPARRGNPEVCHFEQA